MSKVDIISWHLRLGRHVISKYTVMSCDEYMKEGIKDTVIDRYQQTEDKLL